MSDIIPGDKVEAYQQLMTRQFDVHDARDILAMDDAALEMFVTEGEKPLCDDDFIKKIGVLAGDRVLEKPCAADAALGVVQAVCASPYFVRDAIADRNPSRFENGGGDCTVSGTTLDEAKNR